MYIYFVRPFTSCPTLLVPLAPFIFFDLLFLFLLFLNNPKGGSQELYSFGIESILSLSGVHVNHALYAVNLYHCVHTLFGVVPFKLIGSPGMLFLCVECVSSRSGWLQIRQIEFAISAPGMSAFFILKVALTTLQCQSKLP